MTSKKKSKKRKLKESKKPLWKRRDEKKKKKNNSIRFKLIVFLIVLTILSVAGLFVFRIFSSGTWKGRQRYNLLVGKPNGYHALVSVSADEPDALVLVFHPDFVVEGVYGYGDYKIGSLYDLGKLEKLGDELLKKSVQKTLGMKVYGYLNAKVQTDSNKGYKPWLNSLVRPMVLSLIGNEIGLVDVVRFGKRVSSLREDQIEVLNLHESRLAITVIQPDQSQLYQFDKMRLDGYLLGRIKGLVYTDEGYGVSVVNTTEKFGLATSFSRLLLNSGLDVVGVSENQMNLDKTQLLVKNKEVEGTETAKFVKSALDSYDLLIDETDEYRADLVVLIGNDFYRQMHEKPEN